MTTVKNAHTVPPVTDAAHGDVIPGLRVTLTDSSGVVVASTTTNENGEYSFRLTGVVQAAAPATSPASQPAGDASPSRPRQPDLTNEARDMLMTRPGGPAEQSDRQSTPDDDDDRPSPRGRWRRGRVVLVGVVVVALMAGTGWFAWTNNWLDSITGSSETAPSGSGPAATAVVELGTLSATESWDGTLGYGMPFTVTSSSNGTVTRLAGQGAAVERGTELYRVNEQPVTLLYGVVPMYRDLGPGASGADVEQLATNLAELGYEGFTVADEYTEFTAAAVRAWQEDLGIAQTGTVARGDVVFVPEGGQVDALRSDVGDVVAPGMPVLYITSTDQVVSLQAAVDDRDRFVVDTEVTVLPPGGGEVAGTVRATAVVEAAAESPEEADAESILQVEVALAEPAPAEFVGASVEVIVAVDERADVLMVPVSALLALTEGGYGLEVVADDGTTSIVPVDTGLFADGKVQVEGEDIGEGTVVGVAGR